MINYRGLKKLLGETSLERKCRLLFGVALMTLITTSFWVYAGRTRQLVESQQIRKAEGYVPEILWRQHMRAYASRRLSTADAETGVDNVAAQSTESDNSPNDASTPPQSSPSDNGAEDTAEPESASDGPLLWKAFDRELSEVPDFSLGVSWSLVLADESPVSEEGHKAVLEFRDERSDQLQFFTDDPETGRELHLLKAIRARAECLTCHDGRRAIPKYSPNHYVGMVAITVSMDIVEGELSRNRAILLFSAIITTFIAMLVAYVIVRYIIVKPVLHLKDVSDEIARGNLNLRAEINTGDEFEELSQAFNRMLRHMTTVNDELRGVNDNLDGKVDQLAQANMELFRSNAMKDEFLATMSHELRTPLNSILGFSDVLAKAANLDDRQKRYVENIRTSGRNLMVQINDLLDLAKIESGQMKLQAGEVNLAELIDSQCAQIMPLADQKNIEVRVRHLTSPLPVLQQDGGKIRQILTNLLSNAVKFTPEGGRVRVTAAAVEGDMVELCVEDTGIGIPMHEQSEIFEKFRQGSTFAGERDHVKREFGGTGLGLSIVRELSRLLGGDVYLESEFGKGSMFTVRIPLIAPEDKPDTQLTLDSPSDAGGGRITSVDLLNPPKEASDISHSELNDNSNADRTASKDNKT